MTVTKALPTMKRGGVTIDATTQVIEIHGATAGDGVRGLYVTSSNNTINGLVITEFSKQGIEIKNGSNNTITNCFIGTDTSGTLDKGNGANGILLSGNNNTLTTNTIAYNNQKGIYVSSSTALGNQISHNSLYSNTGVGIKLISGAHNNKPAPTITMGKITDTSVTISGTATSGDTIEVFVASTDSEGKTFIDTATADSSGTWSITTTTTVTPTATKVVATATDTTNGSSAFSSTRTVR
jgi:parallel beta-helix repeat protein